ncbi:MAG TPA: hypothetical protein VGQ36_20400 [Thermoanaerobaculia bacterium]|nr:hypothetical protein [Thermoanaerobaculia bacterium]
MPGAAKWCLAAWILISLLAIGYGGLAALAISIARATTPGRADHAKALVGVLVLVALEAAAGVVLRIALRRRAPA